MCAFRDGMAILYIGQSVKATVGRITFHQKFEGGEAMFS